MAIPRPKILTAITVPVGGWTLKVYFSNGGPLYNTAKTITIPAGDYFISDDYQSDDLLYQIAQLLQDAAGAGNISIEVYLTDIHHVEFYTAENAYGSAFKLAWTESSAALAVALGFDGSADDIPSAPDTTAIITSDWQHAYGWYADDDGQLENKSIRDTHVVSAAQAVNELDGGVKTQMYGDRFTSSVTLSWLSRALMYSGETDYGAAPAYPYTRNTALECWWREARQGKNFRLYENGVADSNHKLEGGTATGGDKNTLVDSARAWVGNKWVGYVARSVTSPTRKAQILSNTATSFDIPNNEHLTGNLGALYAAYGIYDVTYRTYVLDLQAMNRFDPKPMARELDYYGLTIPLLRYVA